MANADVKRLRQFGDELRNEFPENLAVNCKVTASSQLDDEHNAINILDEEGYWQCGAGDSQPEIIIEFNEPIIADKIVLKENIATGQQIEGFDIYVDNGGDFYKVCSSTIIGAKRICRFKKQKIHRIVIVITSYRVKATLNSVELYCKQQ